MQQKNELDQPSKIDELMLIDYPLPKDMIEKYNKIGSDIILQVSSPRNESFEINYDYEVNLADLS